MVLLLSLFLLPVFIILIFIPYWTRKTESFGVSIPEELYYTDELKAMRKRYAIQTTVLSVISLLVFLLIYFIGPKSETAISIVYGTVIILFIVASFFIYLIFHRQMKDKKQTEDWGIKKNERIIINTKFREHKLTISNWLYTIPIVATLITIVFTLLNFDKIPAKIAMHYDLTGAVTRWEAKSYGTVLILPLVQLSLVIMFVVINIIIEKSKQQVSVQNPDESLQRNVLFRYRWSMFMYITALLLSFMFTFLHVGSLFFEINQKLMITVPIGISFIVLIGSLILAITTGQGGSRITIKSEGTDLVIDRDDDEHWKLGQFYVNKDDPTLFVEKRFGIGWTINFGRPLAWLSLIGLIVIPLLIPLIISLI